MAVPPSFSSFTYDVFLSFRGTDTRYGFTAYLYKALCDKGICTFIDDEELQKGGEITPSLLKSIQESRIAIIVLSTNYASSSFCLDELSNIIDFIKRKDRLVLPVFYKVDPSDVRHQRGSYRKGLADHEVKFRANKETFKDNMERLQKWRKALRQVANLSGFHLKHGDEYEHKFIESIVKEVSKKIKPVPLPVADYTVMIKRVSPFFFCFFLFLQKFVNMSVLSFDDCEFLTRIPDVSGLPNLKELSFKRCENLTTIHDSVKLLDKLEILNCSSCKMLRDFPPIELTSLGELSLPVLPSSFENLTGLQELHASPCEIVQLPSSIANMQKLAVIVDMGSLPKVGSMMCSNVERLELKRCNVSDEFLAIGLAWFANVKDLNLSENNFTIIPECFKEFCLLRKLNLDYCGLVQEIRGIPPNLKHFSARDCFSFTFESISKLLDQKLHEAGNTRFCLPGTGEIPEWFEHRSSSGQPISLWFRNNFPAIALCIVVDGWRDAPAVIINGNKGFKTGWPDKLLPYHTYLFGMQPEDIKLDEVPLKNEWNCVQVRCGPIRKHDKGEMGIHVFMEKNNMEDILFTNPDPSSHGNHDSDSEEYHTKRWIQESSEIGGYYPKDDDCDIGESSLLPRQREPESDSEDDGSDNEESLVDLDEANILPDSKVDEKEDSEEPKEKTREAMHMEISETQFGQQQQHMGLLSRVWSWASSFFPFFQPQQCSQLDNNVNNNSHSMTQHSIRSCSIMAVPPSSSSFTYDVFLSFRGIDTRHGFIGNLYKALDERGIHTFIDDEDIKRGDEITPSLLKAVKNSRNAIVLLSENYASSSFCLDELSNIIDFIKGNGGLVLPIFYNVVPSDVRHQRGSYGEALDNHEKKFKANKERLQKWKTALEQVAKLSGYYFKNGDEYEHNFIERIVKEVSSKIKRVHLPIVDYPVGLESRVEEVKLLMDIGSDDGVHMVGIHGISGVGKTTLALAVYNSVAEYFEGLCFLQNVRENSHKHGLPHLQEILLSQIVGGERIELASIQKGSSEIQCRLQQKKVLLILDDVDKQEQLQAIAGRPDWFGPGSRVIITTRVKHLLACHEVRKTYKVKELNEKNALELLRWKAFKTDEVDPSYTDILYRVVTYACGLPLALEVIGSNLFGKSKEEWEFALNQYQRIPNKDIRGILKVSFDALEEEEKSVFLDIACCFKGYPLVEVEDILYAHYGDKMKYHIGVLVEKSLIKVSWFGDMKLHDMIADFGKEIIQQESPDKLGNRSRLWFPEDIVQVLEENKGNNKIEIICLDFPLYGEKEVIVDWDGKAFQEMKNLKTLIIRQGSFSKAPEHLPNSLRVLEWWRYPSHDLPSDFHSKNLAICKLPESPLTSLKADGSTLNMLIQSQAIGSVTREFYVLPGQRIPEWFDYSSRGNSVCFWFRKEYPTITVSAVFGVWDNMQGPFSVNFHFYVKINDIEKPFGFDLNYNLATDHIFMSKIFTYKYWGREGLLSENEWNFGEVLFVIPPDSGCLGSIKCTGVYVNREMTRMEDVRFTNPYKTRDTENVLALFNPTVQMLIRSSMHPNWEQPLDEVYNNFASPNDSFGLSCIQPPWTTNLDGAFLDHQGKDPGQSSQAPGTAEAQNIQDQSPTSTSGKVRPGLHLGTSSTKLPKTFEPSLRNPTELTHDDDVEMEAFYASLDAETRVVSCSHDKSATCAPSEETMEALKIVQDFISNDASIILLHPERCSAMKTSLKYLSNLSADKGISREMRKLISEASREFTYWSKDYIEASMKIESTASELQRADEIETSLEGNKKKFREVEALEKELLDKLACMENSKWELEEQINLMKDNISSFQSEKNMTL